MNLTAKLQARAAAGHPVRVALIGAMYKPFPLIGLERSISILNAVLRGELAGRGAAGRRRRPHRLIQAARSRKLAALPVGLAHRVRLRRAFRKVR